jgi:dihydrofolate reductase
MRLVHFGGAMSLDGYIAGPNGEYDWIVHDPEINFAEMMEPFDTFLIGRKTFDMMVRARKAQPIAGVQSIVISRTLKQADYPRVIVRSDPENVIRELRAKPGKDIAIFGGGELFRSLLASGVVDRITVSLIPILLGGGVSFLPPPASRTHLKLRHQRLYQKSGIVRLDYEVVRT